MARPLAPPPSADVQPDTCQPGAKSLRTPQPVKAQHCLKHRFVRGIFRGNSVAQRTPTKRQEKRPMAVDQDGESIFIAALVVRKCAQGNSDKHRSMVVESRA